MSNKFYTFSFLTAFFLTISQVGTSQNVGINATGASADASSMLDVSSTTKGFLAPRMTTAQRNAIATPATGLTVYDTDMSSFYFYNGTSWQYTLSTGTGWGTSGNAGTSASANFIGTTDAVDFVMKTNNTEKMRISSAGNVGIGTSTPTSLFDINDVGSNPRMRFRLNNSALGFTIGYNGVNSEAYVWNEQNTRIVFGTNNSFRMLIDAVGNVGIGTTTPNAPLQFANVVANRKIVLYEVANNDHQYFGFGVNGSILRYQVNQATDAHVFYAGVNSASSLELMRINGSGFVGVGTDSPLAKLHVMGGKAFVNQLSNVPSMVFSGADLVLGDNQTTRNGYGGTNGSNLFLQSIDKSTITALDEGNNLGQIAYQNGIWTIGENIGWGVQTVYFPGNIGIGTNIPGGQLELTLDQGRKPGTNTWTITSDERLKNITGTYTKGLTEILKLNPISYNYKNVGERKFDAKVLETTQIGFSAQEVQKVFPEAVGTDADGYLNFNMHAVLIAYTNAIKELDATNKDLNKRLVELENTVKALSAKTK